MVPCSVKVELSAEEIIMLFVVPPVFSNSSFTVNVSPGVIAAGSIETVFTVSVWCCDITSGTDTGVFFDSAAALLVLLW